MRVPNNKVTVKQVLIVFLMVLASETLPAQGAMPWELERFDQSQYQHADENILASSDEATLFGRYYEEYKWSRAGNPNNYFPTLTPVQQLSKNYLSEKDLKSELYLLMDFLESGSKKSLINLAQSNYQNSVTLPYRFLGAMMENDTKEAGKNLELMKQNGMISPVVEAWGENAVSNSDQNIFMTNGLQDLLAVSWALHRSNRLNQSSIFNGFINKISNEPEDEHAFLRIYPQAWISPTFNPEFLEKHLVQLRLSGIGFKLINGSGSAELELENCVNQFAGLQLECNSPADVGLVNSYEYLAQQIDLLVRKENRGDLKSFQKQLAKYIDKSTRGK